MIALTVKLDMLVPAELKRFALKEHTLELDRKSVLLALLDRTVQVQRLFRVVSVGLVPIVTWVLRHVWIVLREATVIKE